MSKIKDLLTDREKLAKYDELTEWKEEFEKDNITLNSEESMEWITTGTVILFGRPIPDHIKQIIVSAFDAEIKKLDEE